MSEFMTSEGLVVGLVGVPEAKEEKEPEKVVTVEKTVTAEAKVTKRVTKKA